MRQTIPQSGLREVVGSNNLLALKLYLEVARREKGNLFFSPFSVYSALAIVYEGARGSTAEEFRSALDYPSIEALRLQTSTLSATLRAQG